MKPPFHAEHVGSLLRPQRLLEARKARAADLKNIEDECVREVIALQERVGLPSVTDGEYRRDSWQSNFFAAVEGFDFTRTVESTFEFRSESGPPRKISPKPTVTGKLKRLRNIVADDFAFLKTVARNTPKVTMPAPSQMHLGAGDAALDRSVYPDARSFMADVSAIYREEIAVLASLGCTYVQFDECALPILCDPSNMDRVRARGESPEGNIRLYVDALNDAIRDRPESMAVVVHMCRGNAGLGQASGGYEPIAEVAFNGLNVNGFLLEYDRPGAGDFLPLRHLPKGKRAALGLVSTKQREPETVDGLRRRLDEAAKHTDLDQLGLCGQCGFASSFDQGRFTFEDQERKLARIVEVADAVWGSRAADKIR